VESVSRWRKRSQGRRLLKRRKANIYHRSSVSLRSDMSGRLPSTTQPPLYYCQYLLSLVMIPDLDRHRGANACSRPRSSASSLSLLTAEASRRERFLPAWKGNSSSSSLTTLLPRKKLIANYELSHFAYRCHCLTLRQSRTTGFIICFC
jgi:hypothetical protein